MTNRELTRRVIKRIKNPKNWTQHTLARTAGGHGVLPTHRAARSWCAFGAAIAEAGKVDARTWKNWAADRGRDIIYRNDIGSHDEILRLLRGLAR